MLVDKMRGGVKPLCGYEIMTIWRGKRVRDVLAAAVVDRPEGSWAPDMREFDAMERMWHFAHDVLREWDDDTKFSGGPLDATIRGLDRIYAYGICSGVYLVRDNFLRCSVVASNPWKDWDRKEVIVRLDVRNVRPFGDMELGTDRYLGFHVSPEMNPDPAGLATFLQRKDPGWGLRVDHVEHEYRPKVHVYWPDPPCEVWSGE